MSTRTLESESARPRTLGLATLTLQASSTTPAGEEEHLQEQQFADPYEDEPMVAQRSNEFGPTEVPKFLRFDATSHLGKRASSQSLHPAEPSALRLTTRGGVPGYYREGTTEIANASVKPRSATLGDTVLLPSSSVQKLCEADPPAWLVQRVDDAWISKRPSTPPTYLRLAWLSWRPPSPTM